ncbi:ribose-phosphate pyrophosphokinase [bacterium]|jgi:ribose-phosphate pyrophosphokinase|nr:ribose-phosphate pyrophosphokinase [bacterium]MBT4649391.1 ribose-phosphate pyrophosphokinase [bacterium]
MFDSQEFAIIGGTGNHDLDAKVLHWINQWGGCHLKFHHLDMDIFSDGEDDFNIEGSENLTGRHVIVFQSMYNMRLMNQFLTLAWSAKTEHGAKSIIGVVPFYMYRRQDHPEKSEEIQRNLWLAHQMAANHVDKLILCDIHSLVTMKNCEKEGIEVWNVDPTQAYTSQIQVWAELARQEMREFYVHSPDLGSVARSLVLARALDAKLAVTPKHRLPTGEVEIIKDTGLIKRLCRQHKTKRIVVDEDLVGATVVLCDDEISTGSTAKLNAQRLVKEIGVHEVLFYASHAVCTPGWKRVLVKGNAFTRIFLGNTIPRGYEKATGGKIIEVDLSLEIARQLFLVMHQAVA